MAERWDALNNCQEETSLFHQTESEYRDLLFLAKRKTDIDLFIMSIFFESRRR